MVLEARILTMLHSRNAAVPAQSHAERRALGSNIVISWSGTGYHLECASLLSKTNSATVWGNLGASSPVTLPLSGGGQKFFRLVCP